MIVLQIQLRTKTVFCVLSVLMAILWQVNCLNGPNVCMVQQKYNITKRVKYRAPMSVRTYEWCFSMPPRCSRWKTEMRDLTRLETEERTAEVAVCCPGYKMKEVSCIPICPNGRTGKKCTEECPPNKWGPNCVNECNKCLKGICSPTTGDCECLEGWQGESCNIRMTTLPPPALMEKVLTTTKSSIQPFPPFAKSTDSTKTKTEVTSITPITSSKSTYKSQILTKNIPTIFKTEEYTTAIITITNSTISMSDANNNVTLAATTAKINKSTIETTPKVHLNFIYNRTETPIEGTSNNLTSAHVTSITSETPLTTKSISKLFTIITPESSKIAKKPNQSLSTFNEIPTTTEVMRKMDANLKLNLNTTKFKPKEIWIKPTQKGISTEFKIKINHNLTHVRNGGKNDTTSEITTPRTIIVSIIPTSVAHASFKKIALTTATYLAKNINVTKSYNHSMESGFTKSMTVQTSTQAPFTIKILTTKQRNLFTTSPYTKNVTKIVPKDTSKKALLKTSSSPAILSTSTVKATVFNTSTSKNKSTNSMTKASSTIRKPFYTSNVITSRTSTNITENTTNSINIKDARIYLKDEIFRTHVPDMYTTTGKSINVSEKKYTKKSNQKNITLTKSNIITEAPSEDETFHILTEPEHITAVMSDKERENNSLDIISVVSVVGGIMMAVITVAVIIVMFERCRRPRYDDVRKMNDIRMQVMMDENDVPPPYVRSIFHTPLPEPPSSEKCHYQPISTLDRNLKQFMRPVVVQNISPIMLENFRGILECHYDHLPRRSYDIETSVRSSIAPSINHDEQHSNRTMADYTIDALKCEAKLDIIDNDNSEPLYAEIPCWRPPSEYAVEVMNLNGEAVTEL